ncbi:DUF1054 domain-containing protein [Cytobacillus depressus]|uniref:UPF0637 protein F7731_07040 n=1 Tax=Cytobacillus depressus TaxID=1602942 RepID=A0A6L3VCM6_9BACI|nr:DUF1054 domain-containing protein [Cytobacillus depressus]KAB2337360.1 DUF1054 domain-containing protein [Cytobacillus depressus]
MSFSGFTHTDFDVFKIEGLESRMDALITHIRPKLEDLGKHFAPMLTVETGDEIYPHVAKHARRTVNPPKDTWVAFASNSRGYKMLPHFQIGLWDTHVFIWFALIYEAPNKEDFGKKLEKNLGYIYKQIPTNFVWSGDHMKPSAKAHGEMTEEELQSLFIRLQQVKKAEILCGLHIPRNEAIEMTSESFLEKAESVFKTLLPLYKLY